jgi:hypothetical protein
VPLVWSFLYIPISESRVRQEYYKEKPNILTDYPFGELACILLTHEQQLAQKIDHSLGPRSLTGIYLGKDTIHGKEKHIIVTSTKNGTDIIPLIPRATGTNVQKLVQTYKNCFTGTNVQKLTLRTYSSSTKVGLWMMTSSTRSACFTGTKVQTLTLRTHIRPGSPQVWQGHVGS